LFSYSKCTPGMNMTYTECSSCTLRVLKPRVIRYSLSEGNMPIPQMFGYKTLLLMFWTPTIFIDWLKYNFRIITTHLYIDGLHSDNHHCILITVYYIYIYVCIGVQEIRWEWKSRELYFFLLKIRRKSSIGNRNFV
jgi:hypothetical protein